MAICHYIQNVIQLLYIQFKDVATIDTVDLGERVSWRNGDLISRVWVPDEALS